MFLPKNLSVNDKGNLTIGELDTLVLKEEYGSPLYVLDENQISNNLKALQGAIDTLYKGKGLVTYAGKAFLCKHMCEIIKNENCGLDIVSLGELYTAIKAGVSPDMLFLHGNNKTTEELALALEYNVGTIIVDNADELELLNEMAKSAGKTVEILLRVKPGIDPHTHAFIRTGQIDSKFGLGLEDGEIYRTVDKVTKLPHIHLKGIHCHIGSQINELEPFRDAARVMITLLKELRERTGEELPVLDMGGGFGIVYSNNDLELPFESFINTIAKEIEVFCEKENTPLPFLVIEPGRSVVGDAGITLYTVGAVKNIPNIRTYVSVDGGMTDNPRYALYHSEYTAVVANRASEAITQKITLAGKCCESGDLLGENMPLQNVQVGDTVAVLCTGAYNYSMSSNYNRNPRPAVVAVKDKKSKVIVKRETLEDLLRNDL